MRAIFLTFLTIPFLANAQLAEHFDDGNFTESPQWQGTTEKFEVSTDYQLHLAAPAQASDAWLFTTSTAAQNASWQIDVKFEFDPSSQNFAKVYIMADASDPALIRNGYFIMIGGTDDDVSLYQIINAETTKIIDGLNGRLSSDIVSISIKATCSLQHEWSLQTKMNGIWNDEGTCNNSIAMSSTTLGIYCKYSQTRSTKFYFDNIVVTGEPYRELTIPKITEAMVLTGNTLKVSFSKNMQSTTLLTENFQLSNNTVIQSVTILTPTDNIIRLNNRLPDKFSGAISVVQLKDIAGNSLNDTTISLNYERVHITDLKVIGDKNVELTFSKKMYLQTNFNDCFILEPNRKAPLNCTWKNDSIMQIIFDQPFITKTDYSLNTKRITDIQGDTIVPSTQVFTYYRASRHDIVFSELMTDPEPANNLPEDEYIEVKNRTTIEIDLTGYSLLTKNKIYPILSGKLPANGYALLINSKDEPNWLKYGNLTLLNSFPSLTNESGELALLSPEGKVISTIRYSERWKEGIFKDDGGWSYELIDENNLSGSAQNWGYCLHLEGGTPCNPNSISTLNQDQTKPFIQQLELSDSNTVILYFSEGITEMESDSNKIAFSIEPSQQQQITGTSYDTIFCDKMILKLDTEFQPNTKYHLTINQQLTDYSNNPVRPFFPLELGKSDSLCSGDVVINEILFNPTGDGTDFIEIVNRSEKTLLLSDLFISQITDNQPVKLIQLSPLDIPILKDQFWVFSTDSALLNKYHQVKAPWYSRQISMPTMPDDEGYIALTNSFGQIIDRITYSEKWHNHLLSDKEGVSLERISMSGSSQNSSNWQSSASTSAFATPSQPNSQTIDGSIHESKLNISPELITPDNDGTDDFATILCNNAEPGTIISINIYSSGGKLIKQLANNELAGSISFYRWDGDDADGKRAEPGLYIIWCRIQTAGGNIYEEQKVIVVGCSTRQ